MEARVYNFPTMATVAHLQNELKEIQILQKKQIALYEEWNRHRDALNRMSVQVSQMNRHSLDREYLIHEGNNLRTRITMISEEMESISLDVKQRLETMRSMNNKLI